MNDLPLIELSGMDYYFYRRERYTIRYVFKYQGRIDVAHFLRSVDRLKALLPVLTAKIVAVSDCESALKMSTDSLPVRFQVFEKTPTAVLAGDGSSLVDSLQNVQNESLVKLTLTHCEDDSYVGVCFSHLLGDGYSCIRFLHLLSQCFLNQEIKNLPDYQSRHLLDSRRISNVAVDSDRLFSSSGYVMPRPAPELHFHHEELHVSTSDLKALRTECSRHGQVSTNDALMAFLIRRYANRIATTTDAKLLVRCPVDYRRIYPGLPLDYFGNAVQDAVAGFDSAGFDDLNLSDIAKVIRASVEEVGPQSIEKQLVCFNDLRMQQGIKAFEDVSCPGLLVTNLSKLPLNDLNYGVGGPKEILLVPDHPRLAVILPHHSRNGVVIRVRVPRK